MDENKKETDVKLLPKERRLLSFYFQGLKMYLCAKCAGYRSKSKTVLARKTKQVVEEYVSQAGKDDIAQRAGGHVAAWWRDLLWTKKRARARGDLKNMVAVLKMQGEAIGVLKAKEFEGETGATIVLNMGEKDGKKRDPEKKADKSKRVGNVFSFPTTDEESD